MTALRYRMFLQCSCVLLAVMRSSALFDEVVTCAEVGPLQYGDMVASRPPPYKVGTTLTFTCDRGFKGKGKGVITCEKGGRWSGPVPFCQAYLCERDESKVKKGRKCRKPCKSDAECRGTFKRCLCDDWCGKSCYNPEADCPELSDSENGYVVVDKTTYGHTVTYGCNDGYILTGAATRTCRSDRKWSGEEPRCIAFSWCGLSSQADKTLFSGKVVEGTDAKLGSWPWQALFFHSNDHSVRQIYNKESGFGGGSIINNQWILTAGHVFDIFPRLFIDKNWPQKFLLALGIVEYLDPGEVIPEHVQLYEPAKVVRHSNFSSAYYDYDVALVRVGKRLKRDGEIFVPDENAASGIIAFSRYIRPVCLPCMKGGSLAPVDIWKNFDKDECNRLEKMSKIGRVGGPSAIKPGDQAMVTGFGKKRDRGDGMEYLPKKLQEGLLKIVSDNGCIESVRRIQNLFQEARYTDRMICAGSINDTVNTDSCQGDSGGPLVIKRSASDRHKFWIQVGIVSWGWGCGNQYPGYYTSVVSIMGWVWSVLDDSRIGTWHPWNPWTRCTKTCGTGTQFRVRICKGKNCPGAGRESKNCNTYNCPGGAQCPVVAAPVGGSVEVTPFPNLYHVGTQVLFKCGRGTIFTGGPATITCLQNGVWSDSNRPTCEDEWTEWSTWSECTATCNGVKWKGRKCRRGGNLLMSLLSCAGDSAKYTKCNTDVCAATGSDNSECRGGSLLCVKDNLNIDSVDTLGSQLTSLLGILGGR